MKKNRKVFAILTLVAFMITLMPVMAFASSADYNWKGADAHGVDLSPMNKVMYDARLSRASEAYTQAEAEALASELKAFVAGFVNDTDAEIDAQIAADVKLATGKDINGGSVNPPQPTGDISETASVIATRDADATVETVRSFDKETSVEVELVLKNALGDTLYNADSVVYVWAESTSASNQASDAMLLGGETSNNGIFAVDVKGGVKTLKACFLRAGSYKIMASLSNPDNGGTAAKLNTVKKFTTPANKSTVTVTPKAADTRAWGIAATYKTRGADGEGTRVENGATGVTGANGQKHIIDGDKVGTVEILADTVAVTEVTLQLFSDRKDDDGTRHLGNPVANYPIKLSTNSANIELDKTTVSTDYNGRATFNVAGLREGEYKIYVTIGDYESTLVVKVGATAANDIALIKFPSAPIATDTDVKDYKDIFRIQLTDANGNIVVSNAPQTRGAMNATKDVPDTAQAQYAAIISAPTANKVTNKDLYISRVPQKDYYTLNIKGSKKFEAEGDYEVRIVLDNGKSITINFTVKKFDKAVALTIEYPTQSIELNGQTDVPDIYFTDANGVTKKANNRVTVAAQGYAVAKVEESGDEAGVLRIKNDEKYVGQTITVTAISDKENLIASTTLTVADEAREIKLDTTRGQVNASNRVGFKLIDSTGNPVAVGTEGVAIELSAVVVNTGDADAKVSYSIPSSAKTDLATKGTGVINLSSNKQTTATVQIVAKVTKTKKNADGNLETNDKDNNTGLSTTYYSGTETFTFGAEADKSVVMTIGSKEIVAQNVPVTIDVAPFIQDNRTYVPFRALVEAFGAEVDYNADNNTVTTKLDGKTVVLTVGSTVLTVNDETVTMDVAPFIVDDRVVVPVRFVGEAFGFTVEATQDADTGATASVVFYQK